MRTQLFLTSFVLISSTLFLASCSSSSSDSNTFVPVDPFMEADIDGTTWAANTDFLFATKNSGNLVIEGIDLDDTSGIKIVIFNYTGLGDYNFVASGFPNGNNWALWSEGTDANYLTYIGGSGTVEITSDNESNLGKQVGGIFSFTANSVSAGATVDVTNGEFIADIP